MKKKLFLITTLGLLAINCSTQTATPEVKTNSRSENLTVKSDNNKQVVPTGAVEKSTVETKSETNETSNVDLKIPAEVEPFINQGTKAIALESADLNGDKTKDYVLVLEKLKPEKDKDDFPVNQRPLIILVRDENNKLSEVKRNEKMVMCSECGGVMGDAFETVEVGEKTFTVINAGGSGMRWNASYKFNYSRIDETWQLVKIRKVNYNSATADKDLKETILTPKKFGKVDIANFDPDKFDGN